MDTISIKQRDKELLNDYLSVLSDFRANYNSRFYRIICVGRNGSDKNVYKIVSVGKAWLYAIASFFSQKYGLGIERSLLALVKDIDADRQFKLYDNMEELQKRIDSTYEYINRSGILFLSNRVANEILAVNKSIEVEIARLLRPKVLKDVPKSRELGQLNAENLHRIRDDNSPKVQIVKEWVRDFRRGMKPEFISNISPPKKELSRAQSDKLFKDHLTHLGLTANEVTDVYNEFQKGDSDSLVQELNDVLEQLDFFFNNKPELVIGALCYFYQPIFGEDTQLGFKYSEWRVGAINLFDKQNIVFACEKDVRDLIITIDNASLKICASRAEESSLLPNTIIHSEVGLTFDRQGRISDENAAFYQTESLKD